MVAGTFSIQNKKVWICISLPFPFPFKLYSSVKSKTTGQLTLVKGFTLQIRKLRPGDLLRDTQSFIYNKL